MQRQRFISPRILQAFEAIAKAAFAPREAARQNRRAFNKLGGYSYKSNGLRECERRKRQIENKELKVENGLQE